MIIIISGDDDENNDDNHSYPGQNQYDVDKNDDDADNAIEMLGAKMPKPAGDYKINSIISGDDDGNHCHATNNTSLILSRRKYLKTQWHIGIIACIYSLFEKLSRREGESLPTDGEYDEIYIFD